MGIFQSFFTTKLSQKIRNIRWKWNKRGKGEGTDLPVAKRKKAPRKFDVEIESNGKWYYAFDIDSQVLNEVQ